MLKELLKKEINILFNDELANYDDLVEYKDNLHLKPLSRLNREIYFAEYFELEDEFVALFRLVRYLKKNDIPYYLKDNSSNLYLMYLLGISRINPLDFNLSYENYYGLELDKTKIRNSQCVINISVPKHHFKSITQFAKGDELLADKDSQIDEYNFMIGKLNISHFDMPINITDYFSEVDYELLLKFILEEYIDTDFLNALKLLFKDKDTIDLPNAIKVHGLLQSTWNYGNILSAFKELDMPLSEVPVFYDDVFDILSVKYTNKDAWKYADKVHWGKDLPKEVNAYIGTPRFKGCNHAIYMFPKAYTIQHFIHQYKIRDIS